MDVLNTHKLTELNNIDNPMKVYEEKDWEKFAKRVNKYNFNIEQHKVQKEFKNILRAKKNKKLQRHDACQENKEKLDKERR